MILIFFMGFKSWDVNFKLVKKRHVNLRIQKPVSNFKKVIECVIENVEFTPSPMMSKYIHVNIQDPLNNNKKMLFIGYSIYSLFIFLLLCIQPVYLLTLDITQDTIVNFCMNILSPLGYLWGKYYFSTDHYEKFTGYRKTTEFSILCISIISISLHSVYINSFIRWDPFETKIIGDFIIIITLIYSRTLFMLNTIVFTNVFCSHCNKIKCFIRELETNEFDFSNSTCLSRIISVIAEIRYKIEISINFFNCLVSVNTIFGIIALSIFTRGKLLEHEFLINDNEIPIVHDFIFYIMYQIVFFSNIIRYSFFREKLVSHMSSVNFINRFLYRYDISKIKKRYKNDITKIILNFEEENSTTMDWIVINKLIECKWMNFSILGISTQDGALIKKSFVLSAIIISAIKYF
jgi:hypothetical protein